MSFLRFPKGYSFVVGIFVHWRVFCCGNLMLLFPPLLYVCVLVRGQRGGLGHGTDFVAVFSILLLELKPFIGGWESRQVERGEGKK